jgi:hypothetical protein
LEILFEVRDTLFERGVLGSRDDRRSRWWRRVVLREEGGPERSPRERRREEKGGDFLETVHWFAVVDWSLNSPPLPFWASAPAIWP